MQEHLKEITETDGAVELWTETDGAVEQWRQMEIVLYILSRVCGAVEGTRDDLRG